MRDHALLLIVYGRYVEFWIRLKSIDVLLRRLAIVESQGCAYARRQYLGLDRNLPNLLRGVELIFVQRSQNAQKTDHNCGQQRQRRNSRIG